MSTVSLVPGLARKVAELAPVRFGIKTIPSPAGETTQFVEMTGGVFRTFVK
jgi:hypothetical protein